MLHLVFLIAGLSVGVVWTVLYYMFDFGIGRGQEVDEKDGWVTFLWRVSRFVEILFCLGAALLTESMRF